MLGVQDRSTHRIGARWRLAAGAALAVTATSVVVLGATGTALASSVGAVTGAATPASAGATAQYAITFTPLSALTAGLSTITIDLPTGTVTPPISGDYTVNGQLLKINPVVNPQNITLTTPVNVAAGSAVVIGAVHITNPIAGSWNVTVRTSADTTAASSATPYIITAASGSQLGNVTAKPVPANAGSLATYTIAFNATHALAAGAGTITLTAPGATNFPLTAANYTVNGTVVSATPTGSSGNVTLMTPLTLAQGGQVTVVATGVTNPGSGVQALTVASSSDATFSASDFYTILAAAGGGGGAGGSGPSAPVRLFGADRFGTAIAASQAEFTDGTAGAVVLARADDYPDALVGTALAAAKHAPLLFASGGTLTTATQTEIKRVLPAGGTVYLLGGTAAIPATVATAITGLGYVPVRYFGTDRFGTALAVATALGNPSTVLLATGTNFPDALAAGPAAAHLGGVVLLTNGTSLTAGVQAYLTAHPGKVYAVGGPAVTADKSATALSGADRYGTATAVAAALFSAGSANVGIASGTTFADALSGGAFEAHFSGPVLLTDPNTLPSSTSTYLTGSVSTIATTTIFGGTAAVSAGVASSITAALGLS